jgi:O-antigen/teichoic acid export membrane protein
VLLGAATNVLAAGAFLVVAQNRSVVVALFFAVSAMATCLHSALAAGLRGMEKLRPEIVIDPTSRLLFLVVAASLALTGYGLPWIAATYALADVLTLVAYGYVVRRLTQPASNAVPRLGGIGVLAVAIPIAMVYWRIDSWLLALLSTGSEVAKYGAAYRLLDAALLPTVTLTVTLIGRIAVASESQRANLIRKYAVVAVFSVAPFLVVAAVAAEPVLRLIFGATFAEAAPTLLVLAVAAVPSALCLILSSALAVWDRRSYAVLVTGILTLNMVLNAALLGKFGALGAAWVTLTCQTVFMLALGCRLRALASTLCEEPVAIEASLKPRGRDVDHPLRSHEEKRHVSDLGDSQLARSHNQEGRGDQCGLVTAFADGERLTLHRVGHVDQVSG